LILAIYPEHFLPFGSALPVYDPVVRTHRLYVAAQDRYLRQSLNQAAFHHTPQNRNEDERLNVFLVTLNAEIKFRRYLEKIRLDPPQASLRNVLDLTHRTMELVELIYWQPKPAKGSKGEAIITNSLALRRRRAGRPENSSNKEDVQSMYDPRGCQKQVGSCHGPKMPIQRHGWHMEGR